MFLPLRGEVWLCDFDPVRGHEQGEKRPALIVSADPFNSGPAELVVVLPITSKHRGIPMHVELQPPEGGAKRISYVLCEQIRCISRERLIKRWGEVEQASLSKVEERIRILLDL